MPLLTLPPSHPLCRRSGEPLSVIGNLPYYITSQILFSVVDAAPNVRRAIVTMQLEVAQVLFKSTVPSSYTLNPRRCF